MKKILLFISILIFFHHSISYALIRHAPGGGNAGYNIQLTTNKVTLSEKANTGSDGNDYYAVLSENRSGIRINNSTATAYGAIICRKNFLEGDYTLKRDLPAYHNITIYRPNAGFTIKGLTAYQLNANIFYTLYSRDSFTDNWINIRAKICNGSETYSSAPTESLHSQFPFKINFYIRSVPIDGKIVIPSMLIAGYTRIYQDIGVPSIKDVQPELATLKLNLKSSVINFPISCKANMERLNINFNTLDATNFNKKLIHTVNYQCDRSQSAKVKLSLNYTVDSDPQKRVPLKSDNNTIYATLRLHDTQTNQRGKTIETTIDGTKNIEIESHLSGKDKKPGRYSGNAWLIATFL